MFGNIKSFSVYGLFGVHDVHLTFENNIKILIGENGLGKTHILNLFYYTLTRNFFKLREFNFNKIELKFRKEKKPLIIKKEDINKPIKHHSLERLSSYHRRLVREVGIDYLFELKEKYFESGDIVDYTGFLRELGYHPILSRYDYKMIYEVIQDMSSRRGFYHIGVEEKDRLKGIINILENELCSYNILYFPTYRRVEEDLHNLGIKESDEIELHGKNLIQFGMDDVQRSFTKLESKINQLLKEGLTQFTNGLLSMVIEEKSDSDRNIFDTINVDDVSIILARAGSSLTDQQKEAVKSVVLNKKVSNPLLLKLLQKLIEIYEKQKKYDNAIIYFRDICNKYLVGKEVFYDESNIKIYIRNNINSEEIPLSKLSSGEKQIISTFSKIYLSNEDEKFIILFDEPELSLSVAWQEKLLPDICNSNSFVALLAVTHSPFIFDNSLDIYASNLKDYFNNTDIENKKR